MIIWINGAFGAGKTQTAFELHRRLPGSFVFDPENAGYYIRRNVPAGTGKDDFQNYPMWRDINYRMLKHIAGVHEGVVIVPMTVVEEQYFDEIVGRLRRDGIDVRHFTLFVSLETVLNRLRRRGDFADSWPARQAPRCVEALGSEAFREHVDTERLSVPQTAALIADRCGLALMPDDRGILRREFDRVKVTLRHIRFRR